MTQERLVNAVTELDSDIIDRYFTMKSSLERKAKKRVWIKCASLVAACLALTVFTVPYVFTAIQGTHSKSVYDNFNAKSDYAILKDKNGFYLTFDDIGLYEGEGTTNHQIKGYVEFGSVKEFKDTVVNSTLTTEQKAIISNFKKDESNRILTCDFDNLFVPNLPSGVIFNSLSWNGETYGISIKGTNNMGGVVLLNWSETAYNNNYQTYYQNIFDNMTITETKELEDGKTVIYYHSDVSEMKNIRYTLKQGDKTFIVDESYCLSHKYESAQVNSEVPLSVTMYCTDEDGRYIIDLYGFDSVPTADWLLGFGIEKYTES